MLSPDDRLRPTPINDRHGDLHSLIGFSPPVSIAELLKTFFKNP
jgi:hypothetical protein